MDILLEWREHFKLGHPISNVITAKLEFLNKKLDCVSMLKIIICSDDVFKYTYFFLTIVLCLQESRLTDSTLNYLKLLLYNGYYCFEAITERNLDDVICGVCGVIGEVYLGDGNEKNCCSNKNVRSTLTFQSH